MARGAKRMQAWEKKLAKIIDPVDRSLYVSAIRLRKEVSKNFDKAQSPSGKKWKKRKRRYSHPILQKTKRMRRSWRVRVVRRNIKFSNTVPYTRFHQHGTDNMSARPQAPVKRLPKAYKVIIEDNLIDELDKYFGGAV